MEVIVNYPKQLKLKHKASGRTFNCSGSEFVKYESEAFDVVGQQNPFARELAELDEQLKMKL